MAFFVDTFTEGSNQDLENHTPNTGTSWTQLWADNPARGWDVIASSGIAQCSMAGGVGNVYTADVSYPSADYDVTVTMTQLSSQVDDPIYLFVRIQDQENMYAVRLIDQGGSGTCQLYKKVSGTWTALGSTFDPPADGSVVRLEIIGTVLKFYDDGVQKASATDSGISIAGKAGIGGGGGAELVTSTDDLHPNNSLDDLSLNALAGGLEPSMSRWFLR